MPSAKDAEEARRQFFLVNGKTPEEEASSSARAVWVVLVMAAIWAGFLGYAFWWACIRA